MNKICFEKKLTASVLAANALSIILPVDVEASTITGVTPEGNVYNIEAVKHSGSTGFRQYADFTLDAGDIANLQFKSGQQNFVNLVDNRVNINGILNTMQGNNFYNGHAIFVSPAGIVIGSTGVLNVGSFSALTPSQSSYDSFKNAYNSNDLSSYQYNADKYKALITDSHGNVVINGKIFARGDVNVYGDNITIQGSETDKAGIIAGWNDSNTKFDNINSAKTVFNNLVSNNITDTTNFALQNGKIKIVASKKSGMNDAADDISANINIKNANLGSNEIDIKSNAEVDRQERIALAKAIIDIEDSNLTGDTVSIVANASQNKSLNISSVEDDLALVANTLADIFSSDTPGISTLWGVAGKAQAEVSIKNSVIQAVNKYTNGDNIDTSIVINAIASSETEENANFLTPTILDFLSGSEAKIGEYFSNDVYNAFEGAKSSAKVTIDNSTISAKSDNSGDIDISTNASSSLDANNRILSFILPVGMYGVGTETESKAIVKNNSTINADNGSVGVNALSTNENSIALASDSTVSVVFENAYMAMLLNNTVKTDTEASIINSTVNATDLDVLATNLSNSEAEVSMGTLAGSTSQGGDSTGNSSISVTGILNRSDNKVTALIKDSTVNTDENTNVVAQNLNVTKNTSDASILDLMMEMPKTFDKDLKNKIKGFQLKYLNESIFNKIKGKQQIKATQSATLEAGGALVWNNTNNETTAKIESSTVNSKDVTVKADTVDLISNSATVDTYGEEKVGIGLSVIYNEQHNTTKADVDKSTITADNLTVDAMTELPMNQGKLTFGFNLPFSIMGVDKIQIGAKFAAEANGKMDVSAVYPQASGDADSDFEITGLAEQNISSSYGGVKPKFRMSGFFNNMAKSSSGGSTADVSGSVIYNEVINNTTADITNNSMITLSDQGNLTVNAVNSVMGFNGAGLVDILIKQINYKIPGQQDWKYEPTYDAGTFGVGANFLWNDYTNNATAKIENSTVKPKENKQINSVNVNAATEQAYFTLTLTGGKSEKIGIDGSIQNQKLKGTTLAQIINDEKDSKKITAKSVNVNAGKAKVKTTGGTIKRDEETNLAKLKDERDAEESITNIIAQGAWTSQYAEVDNTVQQNSFGIAVGASVGVTNIDRTVRAEINKAVINADNIKNDAYSYNQNFNLEIAGAFSGGVTQQQNNVADAQGAANNAQDDDNIFGNLFDNEDQYMRNPVGNALENLQSQFSLSAAGSVIVTNDDTKVESSVKNSTINAKDSLNISSDRESRMLNITGAVAKSKKVGAGAGVNVYKQEGSVKSFAENSAIAFSGTAPELDITANNKNQFVDVAIGAGVASNSANEGKGFQAAVGGSASINTLKPTIEAYIKNSTVKSTGGNIATKVAGKNDLTIYNIAGGGSYLSGANSGVSAGAAFNYNNIKNTINSYIQDSTLDNIKTLDVLSSAKNYMREFAVAGAIVTDTKGFNITFAGSADVDYIHDTITSKIINSTISADNNINIGAKSDSENLQVAGSFDYSSGKNGVGVGGDVAVNVYRNDILAEIDSTSKILKAQNVKVSANSTEKANVIPVGLSISSGSNFAMVAANVGVNDIENSVKAYAKGKIGTDTNKVNNVNVSAYDETTLYSRGGTLALAGSDTTANIGGAFNRDAIKKTVEAKIDGATIKSQGKVSVSAESINSLGGTKNAQDKYDRDDITSDTYNDQLMSKDDKGNYTDLKHNIITDENGEKKKDYTNSFENWNMFFNLSAGAKASVGGTVVIKTIENTVNAEISGSDITSNNLDVTAQDHSIKNILLGQIAGSSKAAIGAQVLVTKDNSTTSAIVSNNSILTISNALNIESKNLKDNNEVVVAGNFAGKAALNVNVVENTISDNAIAKIINSTVTADTLNISAKEDINASRVLVAATIAANAALSASPLLNYYGDRSEETNEANKRGKTIAEISGSTINGAKTTLQSDTNIKTRDIAVGVSGAGQGLAASGLAIKNSYNTITKAIIDSSSTINTSKDVTLNANSTANANNWIVGVSAVGQGASIIVDVILNDLTSTVETAIIDSTITEAGNIALNTNKNKKDKFNNQALSGNIAGEGAAATANVIYNLYNNNVISRIQNTSVINSNSITAQAFSNRAINNFDIGIGIAGIGADLLANALVNKISTKTLSYVDAQSKTMNTSGALTVKAEDDNFSDNTMGFGVAAGLGAALGANINLYYSDNIAQAEILSNSDGQINSGSAEIASKTIGGLDNNNVGVAAGLVGIAGDVVVVEMGQHKDYTSSETASGVKKAHDRVNNIYNFETPKKDETGSISRVNGNLKAGSNVDIKAESKLKGKDGDTLKFKNTDITAGLGTGSVAVRDIQLNNNTISEITGGNVESTSGKVSVNAKNTSNVEIKTTKVDISGLTFSGGSSIYNNKSNTIAQIGSTKGKTTVKGNSVDVIANSSSKSDIDSTTVVVTGGNIVAVDLNENKDENNSIAKITGKTDITSTNKLTVHSTVNTDLSAEKETVSVTGANMVSVSKNEVNASTVSKAIMDTVEGKITANGIDIITDYDTMSAFAKSNVTAVKLGDLYSGDSSGATMNADFTSGIFKQAGTSSKPVYNVADTIISNSGATTITTAKKNGSKGINAKSEIKNVHVSLQGFVAETKAEAKNTATSNTILKAKSHSAKTLNINSYLDSVSDATAGSTKATIAIGVNLASANANDTSKLNMDIAGTNTISDSAVIKAIHNAKVNSDMSSFNFGGIVGGGLKVRIKSELASDTIGNIGGNFNANSTSIDFATNRNSILSKSSGSGSGVLNISDTAANNTLKGSSILNINNYVSNDELNNKISVKNTSTNKFNAGCEDGSGGIISISKQNDTTELTSSTTTNIINSTINSKDYVDFEVTNNTLLDDSGTMGGGGFVAVLYTNNERKYTSSANLNLENTQINAETIRLLPRSDISSNVDSIRYRAVSGGFVAVDTINAKNTLEQTSSINLKNSKLYAKDRTWIYPTTKSSFKQDANADARGFGAGANADLTLDVTNTNKVNIDSSSVVSAVNGAVFYFDSNNNLASTVIPEAYGFVARPNAASTIKLAINNELNNQGLINAGNQVVISYMPASVSELTNWIHTKSVAFIAGTKEKGTVERTVNNKLIVPKGAKITSDNEIWVSYLSGKDDIDSKVKWETESLWGLIKNSKTSYPKTLIDNYQLSLDGEMIAGQGSDKYLKIKQDGSIDGEVSHGFSANEYSLKGGDISDGQTVKDQKLASIKIKIKDAELELSNIEFQKSTLENEKSPYDNNIVYAQEEIDDFNYLVNNGYTLKNSEIVGDGAFSDFSEVIHNDLKSQIVGDDSNKISLDKYNSLVTSYKNKLLEISEYNKNHPEDMKISPSLSEYLTSDTSLGLSQAQKNTINTSYDALQNNVTGSKSGNFIVYTSLNGEKYVAVENPREISGKITCNEIEDAKTQIATANEKIQEYDSKIAALDDKITNLTNSITALEEEKTTVNNTHASEFVNSEDKYSVVFNNLQSSKGLINISGIKNGSQFKGNGTLKVVNGGVKVDNYSTRSLIFDDIDTGSNSQSGLIIDGKNFAEFANKKQAVNGSKAREYVFHTMDFLNFPVPASLFSFEGIGTEGAHFITGSNSTTSGIIINNFYDIANPFAKNQNILNPTSPSDIIFNGSIGNGNNLSVFNDSGSIIAKNINAETIGTLNLIATKGDINLTSSGAFELKAQDNIFAGNSVNIKADNADIKGKITAGYNKDLTLTITDDMLKNLTYDPTTNEDGILINLGNTPWLNKTNNVKALYKDNQIYLFNINDPVSGTDKANRGKVNIEANTVSNTGTINMYDGYQNINIDNKTDKQLNVYNISNTKSQGGLIKADAVLKSAENLANANTKITSNGKLVLDGAIKNNLLSDSSSTHDIASNGVLDIVSNNGLEIKKQTDISNNITNSISAAGNVNITNNAQDSIISGQISDENGDISILNKSTGNMTIEGIINHNIQNNNVKGMISIINSENSRELNIVSDIKTKGIAKEVDDDLIAILIDNQSTNHGLSLGNEVSARIGDIIVRNTSNKLFTGGNITNSELGNIKITNSGNIFTNMAEITNTQGDVIIENNKDGDFQLGGAITNLDGNTTISNNSKYFIHSGTISNSGGNTTITNAKGVLYEYGKISNSGGDITIDNKGSFTEITDAITNEGGSINISNSNGHLNITSIATIANTSDNENDSITFTNAGKNLSILGTVTSTDKGDIKIVNTGVGDTNLENEISAATGNIEITNSTAGKIYSTQNMALKTDTGNITIKNDSVDGAIIAGIIQSEKGDITFDNLTAGDVTLSSEILAKDGSVKINNIGTLGNLEISGDITVDKGSIDITQDFAGDLKITSDILKQDDTTEGDINISNKDSGDVRIDKSASIQNNNGNVFVHSEGTSDIFQGGTIIASGVGKTVAVTNTEGSVYSFASIINTQGDIYVINTTGDLIIDAGDDDSTIYSTAKGNILIGNASGDFILGKNAYIVNLSDPEEDKTYGISLFNYDTAYGMLLNGYVYNTGGGDINIQNQGQLGATIAGTIENEIGDINIQNDSEALYMEGEVTAYKGDISIINNGVDVLSFNTNAKITSEEGNIEIKNRNGGDNIIEGLITAKKGNILLENKDSNILIGEYESKNNSYINANNGNVTINQTNGSIINSIVDASDGNHQNYNLANKEQSYKTLIKSSNDIILNVIDGSIGSTANSAPGFSIDAKTRDWTESININTQGSVIAKAINENSTDKQLVNLRAVESDLNIDSIESSGNVILTAADWKQEDTRPTPDDNNYFKGYSILNASDDNYPIIKGQNISLIASDKIGTGTKQVIFEQDTLNAPNSSVSVEAENDLNISGKSNSNNDMKIYQMLSKHGIINFGMESDADIAEITAGGGLKLTQKYQNLTIRRLGFLSKGLDFDDILYPHDDIKSDDMSLIPKYVDIKVLDAMDTPERADSTLKIYSAYVRGNNGPDAEYNPDGTKIADYTLMADNIYANSDKAPDSNVSTKSNPKGYKQTGKTYTDADFGGDDTVYSALGLNVLGNSKDTTTIKILGVDKSKVDDLIPNAQRNNYKVQKQNFNTPSKFQNSKSKSKNNDYKANDVVLSINDYGNKSKPVSVDKIYANNAYINTSATDFKVEDGIITNYAEFRNVDKLGIVDNDFRRLLVGPADIQLYTQKTGSFALGLDRTINMHTTAPTVYNNPHMLVNGYHSEWNFVNKGFKETQVMLNNIPETIQKTMEKEIGTAKAIFMVFDVSGNLADLNSDTKIYSISTTGALIANDKSLKNGDKTQLSFTIDGIDVAVEAKVVNTEGGVAKVEFINLPRSLANKLLYRYMQANSEEINLTAL